MKQKYSHAIVGGTFDRFHLGHKKLLDTAFSQSEFVTVGISTEQLYKNKMLSETIEEYATRESYIKVYLEKNNIINRATLVPIDDIYGTSLQKNNIDAIFVTKDNKRSAELINKKRNEHEITPLEIIVVPFIKGNDGHVITSERIRKGEIDRSGNAYSLLFHHAVLHLPQSMRTSLRNPIGEVSQDIQEVLPQLEKAPMVIAVGDIVSITLAEVGKQADVSVIDLKTRRHELSHKQEQLLHTLTPSFIAHNTSGKIEKEAVECVKNSFESFLETGQKQTLKIIGEEDLLTLPAILLAPLRSVVLYGLFDEGAVAVVVTEDKKSEIQKIITQFESKA